MISIQDVSKTFSTHEKQVEALKHCSLDINNGEIFGVIGYSGAGKSTLVRIINQLERQTSGHVFIDGVDISSLSKKDLMKKRMKIGMIEKNDPTTRRL